jgi:shikimate kinase
MNYPIFLLGFMASGKSTKGRKLAKKLGVEFMDLDGEIETQEKQSISNIFKNHGEEYFRREEANALRSIPKQLRAVIALGGGTPCFHDNMSYINELGTSVYLRRSGSRLLGRLRQSKQERPLVASLSDDELKTFITKSLLQRNLYYEKATVIFDADRSDLADLVKILQGK